MTLNNMKYEIVVGLEVHLQTNTKSKMFCSCAANYFGDEPNTHTCPVCLGLPGALPVPNKAAIDKAIKIAMALNCEINKESKFDRKNYFYPDLPKGYQISQYDQPIGENGYLEFDIDGKKEKIRITRVHQEEDTGKSVHEGDMTLLDYNKSGKALVEIVSEPDMHSVEQVLAYAKRLRQIVRYLGVSNADMEKGEMRFEVNMSLRPMGQTELPNYKVEVKNIGSISVLEKVIEKEYARHSEMLDRGETPKQETRGLKNMSGDTVSQRSKESEADYRYFPEPDIPPMIFTDEYLENIRKEIPELPQAKKDKLISEYGIDTKTAEVIVSNLRKSRFVDEILNNESNKEIVKAALNWVISDYTMLSKDKSLDKNNVKPAHILELSKLVNSKTITGKAAKDVLMEVFKTGKNPSDLVKEMGLESISDEGEIKAIVQKVLDANPKVVEDIKKNPNATGFILGQVMRETKGKADPGLVNKLIKEILG